MPTIARSRPDFFEYGFQALLRPQSAAQLAGNGNGPGNGFDHVQVDRLARTGPIQIDEVQPLGPCIGPALGHLARDHPRTRFPDRSRPDGAGHIVRPEYQSPAVFA